MALSRHGPVELRFRDGIARISERGCWEWGGRLTNGYGYISRNNAKIGVHRYSYEAHNGPIPGGQHVLHKCDNSKCVNPAHLRLGTHLENVADMVSKRRQAAGGRHGRAKLRAEQVRAIRSDTRPQRVIAKDYGVSRPAISLIKSGRTWADLA